MALPPVEGFMAKTCIQVRPLYEKLRRPLASGAPAYFIAFRGDIKKQFKALIADNVALKADTDKQFAAHFHTKTPLANIDIKKQVKALKDDTDKQFVALKADNVALKADTDKHFVALKADTDKQFVALKAEVTKKVDEVDCNSKTRFDNFTKAIDAHAKASEKYEKLFYGGALVFCAGTMYSYKNIEAQAGINGSLLNSTDYSKQMLTGLMSGDVVSERVNRNRARNEEVLVTNGTAIFPVTPSKPTVMHLKKAIKAEIESNTGDKVNAFTIAIVTPDGKVMGDEDALKEGVRYLFKLPK